jgi:methylated-DNA-protein-cysteine methyltransferase related protein
MGFEALVVSIVSHIPSGKVMTYLQIAELAGNPRRARHISGILRRHEDLPWHRVISSKGTISLPLGQGYELQRALLADEGILLDSKGKIDLGVYLFRTFS